MTSSSNVLNRYQVEIVAVPARLMAAHRFHAEPQDIPQAVGAAFEKVFRFASERGIAIAGPAVTHYTMTPKGFDMASGFIVSGPFEGTDEVAALELPACQAAVTTHIGPYSQLMAAYDAIKEQVPSLGRAIDEAVMWEEYWTGPETPEEEHKTVIVWPVRAL